MMSMAIVAKTGKPSERETKAVKKEEEKFLKKEFFCLERQITFLGYLFLIL